jgi:hypothetical protein
MPRASRFFSLPATMAVLIAAACTPAFAAWVPGGVPLTSGNFSYGHTVIEDGQGGVLTFWSGFELFATRILSDGSPSATLPLAGAHVGSTTFLAPFTGARRVGGDLFVVAHNPFISMQDGRVQMFRMSAGGVAAPGWPDTGRRVLNRTGPMIPRLDGDGAGGIVTAWLERRPGPATFPVASVFDLRALRVTGSGAAAPGWPIDGVPISIPPDGTTPVVFTTGIDIVRDGTGGMFIAWQDSSDGVGDIYVQRLDENGGIPAGWPAAGRPVCSVSSLKGQLQLASDGAGGVYVAWSEYRAPEYAAFLTRIGPDGLTAAGWPAAGLQVTGAGVIASLGRMAADGSGGAIVGYLEYRDGVQADVFARRFLADATVAPGWGSGVTVIANPTGDDLAGMLPDGAGGAFFLAGGAPGASSLHSGLVAVALDGGGVPSLGLPVGGLVITTDEVTEARLLPAESGTAIATWRGPASTPIDLRGQKIEIGLPTPVQASLIGASAEPGRVRIEWFLSEPNVSDVAIERHPRGGAWAVIGSVPVAGDGRVVYEDLDAPTGAVSYRMVLASNDGELRLGETEVSVPAPYAFALGVQPNPAMRGRLVVNFALSEAAPSRIDVLDVGGRLVLRDEHGTLGAGVHTRRIEGSFPPGVYLVRLVQGERIAVRRAVVIE